MSLKLPVSLQNNTHPHILWLDKSHFLSKHIDTTTSHSLYYTLFIIQRRGWCHKNLTKPWLFYKTSRKYLLCLCCVRNIYDTISTKQIPENTQLCLQPLCFHYAFFQLKWCHSCMMFLSQHRDTQAIFYFDNYWWILWFLPVKVLISPI